VIRRFAALALALAVVLSAVPAMAADRARSRPGSADPPDPYFPQLGNRGYDVQHYDLDLTYDPADADLEGEATITATATAPLRRFHLDLVGMQVESVSVDGRAAATRRRARELVVRPAKALRPRQEFQVRVHYSGTPEPRTVPGLNAPNGWLRSEDGVITLNEPDGARTWFPANDHPTDKATYTFTIEVPAGLTAVANGTLSERRDQSGRTTWSWDEPSPMATYLAQVVIGDLALEDAAPVDGVTIRHAFAPSVRAAAADAAAATPDMLTFLATWFGPYPFETYGVLAPGSGLSRLAFEAQTFSVFAPDIFAQPKQASTVLLHELAHQWFGDWVSPASWRETWLNEGFATYAEWLWSDVALGVPLQRNVEAAHAGATADPDASATDPGRDEMFSSPVYQRGALTLHALRTTVGDDAFKQILRAYLDRFGGKTASTDDFVQVASEIAGSDLQSFFDSWLGPGAPPLLPDGAQPGGAPSSQKVLQVGQI
jgi:aminopeptidase N